MSEATAMTTETPADGPVNGTLLEVSDLSVSFGGVVALDGVSFGVATKATTGLIGPNGAGKTTLFNCLSGLYRPNRGDIRFDGRSIAGLPPHRITALGLGRTFQNLALFGSLSVFDNVLTGAHPTTGSGFLASAINTSRVRAEERRVRERAWQILDSLELSAHAAAPVTSLPFGTRKRVELARALMISPRLLMLDEPATGLNHEEVEALGGVLRSVREQHDLTLLLVEHHMSLVMAISDRVVTLDFGRKIADGTPQEVQSNPAVIAAYLGTGAQ